jgi:DNA-directed RNA polymerase subunit F
MSVFEGNLLKMKTSLGDQLLYHLPLGEDLILMNEIIGKEIILTFTGQINCICCGVKTSKSFAQGYCYKCMVSSPEASECVLRPELCQAHLGISRDMKWSEGHCLQDHYVYLAVSSGLKVGITRSSQVPTRWIDQGAWKAIKLALTPNRYLAGCVEVELKKYMSDKTNWQKMLQNVLASDIDLVNEKQKAWELLDDELQQYVIDDDEITEINYPVLEYPQKVKSLNFDKIDKVKGKLMGIKGQYLIFDEGLVLNIRSHSGYRVKLEF